MKEFDLESIKQELRDLNSISDKLDYWQSVIQEYYFIPNNKQLLPSNPQNILDEREKYTTEYCELFDFVIPYTNLLIPDDIFNEHFQNGEINPEFLRWFLENDAKLYFELFKIELTKNYMPEFMLEKVEREIKRIEDFILSTITAYRNNKFDFINVDYYSYEYEIEYNNEIEYLRVINGYYNSNTIELVNCNFDTAVHQYAEHFYILDYLKDLKINHEKYRIKVLNTKEQPSVRLDSIKCRHKTKVIEDIYEYMTTNNYIYCQKNDFISIFNNDYCEFINPIEWRILSERGKTAGRGNKTALFIFLEYMFGTVSNEVLRRAKSWFVDHQGEFITTKQLVRPDKNELKQQNYGFEDYLKSKTIKN